MPPLFTHVCANSPSHRYYQKIDNDSSAWGKAVATIDRSHTHVFSYLWNQDTYEHVRRSAEAEGITALNKIVHVADSHSMLLAFTVSFGLGVSPRVFATWMAWRKEDDGSFTIAFTPMEEYNEQIHTLEIKDAIANLGVAANAIRGSVKGFWRIKRLADDVCQVRASERACSCPAFLHTCLCLPFSRICMHLSRVCLPQHLFAYTHTLTDHVPRPSATEWVNPPGTAQHPHSVHSLSGAYDTGQVREAPPRRRRGNEGGVHGPAAPRFARRRTESHCFGLPYARN